MPGVTTWDELASEIGRHAGDPDPDMLFTESAVGRREAEEEPLLPMDTSGGVVPL